MSKKYDRRKFREALRPLVAKMEVGVMTSNVVLVCMRAADFDPDSNALWELEANKSAVRQDVRCSGCGSALAVSNAAYATYTAMDKRPKASCMQCVISMAEKEGTP